MSAIQDSQKRVMQNLLKELMDKFREKGYRVRVNVRKFTSPIKYGCMLSNGYFTECSEIEYHNMKKLKALVSTNVSGYVKIMVESPNHKFYMGTSMCCGEDVFDSRVGMYIALKRSMGIKVESADFEKDIDVSKELAAFKSSPLLFHMKDVISNMSVK